MAEHLFICLLAMGTSSLKMCLFKSFACFLNWVVFYHLGAKSYLYFLDTGPLLDI